MKWTRCLHNGLISARLNLAEAEALSTTWLSSSKLAIVKIMTDFLNIVENSAKKITWKMLIRKKDKFFTNRFNLDKKNKRIFYIYVIKMLNPILLWLKFGENSEFKIHPPDISYISEILFCVWKSQNGEKVKVMLCFWR